MVPARADRTAIAPAPVNVAQMVRDRVESWSALAAEQGVSLTADSPPSLGARASEGALEQILDNLIANALDVCGPGTSITIGARAGDGDLTAGHHGI